MYPTYELETSIQPSIIDMSINPINATTIERTLKAHADGKLSTPIISFGPPSKPMKGGSIFYNTKFNVLNPQGLPEANYGFFMVTNTRICSGPPKKGDYSDKRNYAGQEYRPLINLAISDLGAFGEQWVKLNDYWEAEAARKVAEGFIKLGKRDIHALYYKVYGTGDKAGEAAANPSISIKVPVGQKYSDRHPIAALKGKNMLNIYDGRKPIRDAAGKHIGYEPYVHHNDRGEPEEITVDNIDKVLTDGTVVVSAVFVGTGAAASTYTFSLPWTLYKIAIIPPELDVPIVDTTDEVATTPTGPSEHTGSTASSSSSA